MVYRFENYEVDTATFKLMANGISIAVEPQVFDLIVFLIENRERLISRQELFDSLWHDKEVSDTSLSNHIKSARKVLGDNGHTQQIIKTVHGRGYQFIAKVNVSEKLTEKSSQLAQSQNKFYKIIIFVLLASLVLTYLFVSPPSSMTQLDATKPNYLIAVLPFVNTKPDKDTDYLGFSMADRIIGDLNYLKGITVRPSSSVRQYINDQSYTLHQAGESLNVDYLLTGNYLSVANKVRLNAELVNVHNGELIWRSNQIEVDYKNAFELQDIVAQQIMDGLKIELSQADIDRIERDIPENALAYEYYLRSIAHPFSTEGHHLAIALLKKSIALDSLYAPAYVQLGNRIRRLEKFGLMNSGESQNTIEYYQKAISINPQLTSALSNLAFFYTETNRVDEAIKIMKTLLEINPDHAETHFTLGYIYRYMGISDEAIKEMETAISIDSFNIRFRTVVNTYYGLNESRKGLEIIKKYEKGPFTTFWQGRLNFQLKRFTLAKKHFENAIREEPGGLREHVSRAHIAFIDGDTEAGLIAVHQVEQTNIADAEAVYYAASFYGLLGDKIRCIQTLAKAVDGGYFNYQFIESNNFFDSVRAETSYKTIIAKAKQKSSNFRQKYLNRIK